MSNAEEKERGVLTVDVQYVEIAQALNNVIYMCQKLKDRLDIAAIEKGMKIKERRQADRRKIQ